ncbi:Cell surface mannoprotein MP65 [Hypsizygus marmoreus]|uniref:glucan endo-1,3-beta-D-glucosidase n=1 Tax=Hypsizygus marmoreus TaxID=39966 RepID=A0A369JNY9_HYPMA|nr:Cell surface mannoprotein MP65 [Hypsizygus marmoreus]
MKRILVLLFVSFITCQCSWASNHFAGITVSNSITGSSSYTCRTQAQWNELANNAKNSGFRSLRILGFDCGALDKASAAAASVGITVLAGIYVSGTIASSIGSVNDDVQAFRRAYQQYGAGRYVGLTIGNEVNDNPTNIVNAMKTIRDHLRSVGVSTPVSTVHTWIEVRKNPIFCGGDFVGANAHAFFDGHVSPENAGDFVMKTVLPLLRATCPGKHVIISESGWPSRGAAVGTSYPSLSAERSTFLSLNCGCRDDASASVYAFEYDDQHWKTTDIERSFGIFGKINLNGDVLAVC